MRKPSDYNKYLTQLFILLALCCFLTSLSSAQTSFSDAILVYGTAFEAKCVYSADLDGDGDFDVLSASYWDDKIAWYENTDGSGDFGPQQVITTDANGARSVFCADLDGDGDLDVLSASELDDEIAWYENSDGLGDFGNQLVITADADGASSVFSIDLDGDGDFDVLSASSHDNKIAWYENLDGMGDFGPQNIISFNRLNAMSVYSTDLDGDDDNDVLTASSDDERIMWYENVEGGEQHLISNQAFGASSVFSTDLDGDGDKDVLSASSTDDKIAWYENTDGLGSFGPQLIISTHAWRASSVFSIDLDNDGDNDVLAACGGRLLAESKIAWYENTDGLGNFGEEQVISLSTDEAKSVFSADLDGDGDYDVLSASTDDNTIAWYCNLLISSPPDSFNLLEPDSISTITSRDVLLDWQDTADQDHDFANYRVCVGENPNDIMDNVLGHTRSSHYTFTGEYNTEYWWTVIATDHGDHETRANQVFNFTIVEGTPPGPFNLTHPDSGAFVYDPIVPLYWEESIDPEDDLLIYRVYVSENPDSLEQNFLIGTIQTQCNFTGDSNTRYWWSVLAVDDNDHATWANQVYSFKIDLTSVDEGQKKIPTDYELTSIYPNPFNPSTTITIGLPESSILQLNVYNILGQHIAMLAGNQYTAGYQSFILDGSVLPSGIYFVSATVEGKLSETRKVVLMK